GLYTVLQKYRPETEWAAGRFIGIGSSIRLLLRSYLAQVFPGRRVIEGFPILNSTYNLLFYMPEIQLGIEYRSAKEFTMKPETGGLRLNAKVREVAAEVKGVSILYVSFW